jgi:hypothetical protein
LGHSLGGIIIKQVRSPLAYSSLRGTMP